MTVKKKYNLICFSFMPWSNMWKRNQSMMAEMAKFDFIDKVIFVNPDISLRQVLKQTAKNGNQGIRNQLVPRQIHPGVWNYTLFHVLPVSLQNKVFEGIESRRHLKKLRQLNGHSPFILFMNCPNIHYPYPLDELLKNAAFSIFDLSDDFIQLIHSDKGKALYSRNINTYVYAADVVLAVNNYLKKKYTPLNPNIHVINNATNYTNFERQRYAVVPLLEQLKSNNRLIIGYSGLSNIARIDVALLDFLLRSRPDWQFVFVGSKGEELAVYVGNYDNFHHLPAVDYELLPDHINYFNVAIVPFKINAHTLGNNLLKFHDYLAMGKPVVTTNIGGAEDLKNVIKIAENKFDFLKKIEYSINATSFFEVQQRKSVAVRNSWPNRIEKVKHLIINHLGSC